MVKDIDEKRNGAAASEGGRQLLKSLSMSGKI